MRDLRFDIEPAKEDTRPRLVPDCRHQSERTLVIMDVSSYLHRIGADPDEVQPPNRTTLVRLQQAHVTSVAFETLSIVGDPFGEREGEGVTLDLSHLYDKIVERHRGGYCFELNGLFHWLLAELGFDVDRVAARVITDGEARPPANHHINIVELDRRYVVDVGIGPPQMRTPLPLDGRPQTDPLGVSWRITAADRPDATYRVDLRSPGHDEWTPRYVFTDVERDLQYFRATNDYLQTAPESPFTKTLFVALSTDTGYRKLSGTTLKKVTDGTEDERALSESEWPDILERAFNLQYEGG